MTEVYPRLHRDNPIPTHNQFKCVIKYFVMNASKNYIFNKSEGVWPGLVTRTMISQSKHASIWRHNSKQYFTYYGGPQCHSWECKWRVHTWPPLLFFLPGPPAWLTCCRPSMCLAAWMEQFSVWLTKCDQTCLTFLWARVTSAQTKVDASLLAETHTEGQQGITKEQLDSEV